MSALRPPAALQDRLGSPAWDDNDLIPVRRERQAPAEFARLQRTLERTAPACEGDNRFTTDPSELLPGTSDVLRAVCASCPVRVPCQDYARAAGPAGGFWAGRNYPERRTRRTDE